MERRQDSDSVARFLHVIDTLDPRMGGPSAGIETLGRLEGSQNVELDVLCLDYPGEDFVLNFPVMVYGLGARSALVRKLVPRFLYSARVVPWLRAHADNYDCIVVNGIWSFNPVAVWWALRGSVKPYVVFTHGMMARWFKIRYPLKHIKKQIFWTLFVGRVLRDARYVLFTAEDERLDAQGNFLGYSNYRERVICYGPDDVPPSDSAQTEAFHAAVPALGASPFLVFLGRVHPKKGCDILIEAFANLAESNPEMHLVLAGPYSKPYRDSLQKIVRQRGLESRVHWAGMVSGAVKWGALRAAEAFILPSHQENFGIAVVEAMACETPVLISRQVNIWREIVEFGAGMAAADDVAETLNMVRQFMRLSSDARLQMGLRARECFLQKFNGHQFARDMRTIAEELRVGRPR